MADTLAALPSNLRVLWMDGNSFDSFSEEGDLDPPSFAAALPALEVLTLNLNELQSFSTELPQSLTRLELDYAGLTSIAGGNWRELTSLEVLWLDGNELGGGFAETVEQLPPSIRTLDMQRNGIESGNVPDSLADALPALETLLLSDNWFLGAFSTQLPRGLKELELLYTGLTSINGTNWGDLTSLRTVDLR